MVLFVGSFQFLPLALILVVVVLASGIAALAGLAAWAVAGGAFSTVLLGVVPAVAIVAVAEVLARLVANRRRPRHVAGLVDVTQGTRFTAGDVGGKALGLARLARAGLPIPEGVVLCSEASERIRASEGWPGSMADPWSLLPRLPRRRLRRFLREGSPGLVVVRSSFEWEDSARCHAGIFLSVRDVDAGDAMAVARAVGEVLASADGEVVRAYRAATSSRPGRLAVVIQRQAECDLLGIAASRPADGRSDRVVLETWVPGGSHRVGFVDLVERLYVPQLPPGQATAAPAWAWQAASAAVALEGDTGAPVQIEFGRAGNAAVFFQVRTMPASAGIGRRVLVTGGPVDLPSRPVPPLRQFVRGGDEGLRESLGASMAGAGVATRVESEEAGYANGVAFLDAEVVRRAVVLAARPAGIRAALGQAAAVLAWAGCAPARTRLAPPAIRPGTPPRAAFDALAEWACTDFRSAVARQSRVTGRLLVCRRMMESTAGAGEERPRLDAVRMARAFLAWRATRLARLRDAWRRTLETAEDEWLDRVAGLLGLVPGPAARSLVEVCTAQELAEGPGAVGIQDGRMRERALRLAAAAREPVPSRMLEPPEPIPEASGPDESPGQFPGLVVHPGRIRGRWSPVRDQDEGFVGIGGEPRVLLLPDGDPRHHLRLPGAAGVVLHRGGVLCHLAVGIAERGIPALLVTDDRVTCLEPGTWVTLDADGGFLRVEEGP